jgi:dihydroorotate dehydrogenase
MYSLLLKFLFLFDAESVHKSTMKLLSIMSKIGCLKLLFKYSENKTIFCGLSFPNKLGLAAGFDKNADYLQVFEDLGFGFVEIGTVTPLAQDGNPLPRLFRLKKDQAILNRMGFNNKGVDYVVQKLKNKTTKKIIIGGNIGKNKVTPNEEAYRDYEICFEKMYEYVDYFVINVSSPNTPNLRALQEKDSLTKIIQSLDQIRKEQNVSKPIFLKIAPDLTMSQLDDILDVCSHTSLDALICSNTTIDYTVLSNNMKEAEKLAPGGISGAPILTKSNDVIAYLKSKNKDLKIIGVGGIMSKEDAQSKFDLGCDLVQIYSGFIYRGPKLVNEITQLV